MVGKRKKKVLCRGGLGPLFYSIFSHNNEGPEAGEALASPGGTPGKRVALPLAGRRGSATGKRVSASPGEAGEARSASGPEPESVLVGSRPFHTLLRRQESK